VVAHDNIVIVGTRSYYRSNLLGYTRTLHEIRGVSNSN
jgi:CO dehydrogenase/acetyl-CoA synthase epsilon subunit